MELTYDGFKQRLESDGESEKLKAFKELYGKIAGDVQRSLFLLNSISAYFSIANLKAENDVDKKWFAYLKSPKHAGSFSPVQKYEVD